MYAVNPVLRKQFISICECGW